MLLPLVVIPFLELWLLLELGSSFGALAVLAWCVATLMLGVWLMRRQARSLAGALRAAQARGVMRIDAGRPALLGFAGILLAIPGVITDALALGLIVRAFLPRSAPTASAGQAYQDPRSRRSAAPPDVEVIPPGRIASPFRKRPRVIDVE